MSHVPGCGCGQCAYQLKQYEATVKNWLTTELYYKPVLVSSEQVLKDMAKAAKELKSALTSMDMPLGQALAELDFKKKTELAQLEAQRQKETNDKWRPWFESLNDFENEIVANYAPVELWVSWGGDAVYVENPVTELATQVTKFPDEIKEVTWNTFKYRLTTPREAVYVMVRRNPALSTRVPPPCVGTALPLKYHMCIGGCDCKPRLCDLQEYQGYPVYNIIMHLNDDHRYSFTQIADWIDTLGLDFTFKVPDTINKH